MNIKYNRDIFKYPAVQYIPLQIIDLTEGKSSPDLSTRFYIFKKEENSKLNFRLKNLSIKKEYVIKNNELAILIINARVYYIKYRGYEVIMVGERKKARSIVFKITKKYFYKDRLFFSLYDYQDAEKIDGKYLKNI
ncbi:MAG: hypothetical protein ACQEQF_02940 [Bacillota bacterium]